MIALKKKTRAWTITHTQAVKKIKLKAKGLLCLNSSAGIQDSREDALDIGYRGILLQNIDEKE